MGDLQNLLAKTAIGEIEQQRDTFSEKMLTLQDRTEFENNLKQKLDIDELESAYTVSSVKTISPDTK